MVNKGLLGAWGEVQAAEYLRKKRYEVIACNYRTRFGEIDIIAKTKKAVVFVEVKLRKDDTHGEAREFVDGRKQSRLRSTALLWLEESACELQPRFDVIEIYAPEGTATVKPEIYHLEDAFQ